MKLWQYLRLYTITKAFVVVGVLNLGLQKEEPMTLCVFVCDREGQRGGHMGFGIGIALYLYGKKGVLLFCFFFILFLTKRKERNETTMN